MAKNMAAIIAHHRKIVEMHHAPERAPLESVQIVLLADILKAAGHTITGKPAKAKKTKTPD